MAGVWITIKSNLFKITLLMDPALPNCKQIDNSFFWPFLAFEQWNDALQVRQCRKLTRFSVLFVLSGRRRCVEAFVAIGCFGESLKMRSKDLKTYVTCEYKWWLRAKAESQHFLKEAEEEEEAGEKKKVATAHQAAGLTKRKCRSTLNMWPVTTQTGWPSVFYLFSNCPIPTNRKCIRVTKSHNFRFIKFFLVSKIRKWVFDIVLIYGAHVWSWFSK